MHRLWQIVFLFLPAIVISRTTLAQQAFADLPIDDPSKHSILKPGEDAAKKIRNNIFILATLDHPDCYPGQQVLLTYRLYTALQSTTNVTAKPILNGFTVKERKPDETPLPDKIIDGRHYHGFTIWQALITPLQPGEYTLDALATNNKISYTTADGKTAHYSGPVVSKKAAINVMPLPAIDRPPVFAGLVGKWQLDSRLATAEPDSTGSDTLFIEITGAGSFDNIPTPYMRWPVGLKHVEAIPRWEVNENTTPQSGRKIIAIPFTATSPGEYTLPPVQLAYFDPAAGRYHTAQTDSLTVHVVKLPVAAAPRPRINPAPVAEPGFPIWVLAPLLAVVLLVFYLVFRKRRRQEPVAAAPPAPGAPASSLAPPTPAAPPEPVKPPETIEDIKQTLLTFLQTRLNTDAWAEEDLMRLLQEKEPELAEKAARVLDQCNKLLYSPSRPEPHILANLNRRLEEIMKPQS